MDLEYLIGTKLKGDKGAAKKQCLSLGKCRMPDLVSWRSPRDRAVIPYSPDTLERAHEALEDARKYKAYAENDAQPDDIRLAFYLVADDRAQVAHLLAGRYKEHFKECVNVLTPDFDDMRADVEMGLRQFRYDVGANPGSVSGEWYFEELLSDAIKHVKDIREYNSKIGLKRPVPKTVVLPRINAQQSTKRYAPGQLPLPIPAQVSQPQPAYADAAQSANTPAAPAPTPQYTGSVAAGGN